MSLISSLAIPSPRRKLAGLLASEMGGVEDDEGGALCGDGAGFRLGGNGGADWWEETSATFLAMDCVALPTDLEVDCPMILSCVLATGDSCFALRLSPCGCLWSK